MPGLLVIFVLLGCRSEVSATPISALSAADRLTRASVLLVGARPGHEAVLTAANPGAFEDHVDAWLEDPRFGATVREIHNEAWQLDTDFLLLPANGPLGDIPMTRIRQSLNAAPLFMAQHVVTEDMPYTTLLTADWVVLDNVGNAAWSNVRGYQPNGPRWQTVQYDDGRPMAGLLSYDMIWLRWRSAGANHDRGRANAISKALLCDDYLAREVRIDSNLDLTDPDALSDALRSDPACLTCHQTLDPLASAVPFNPYRVILELEWPETMYHPAFENNWLDTTGVPPSYFGHPLVDFSDLGAAIAEDPRFARCTARRVAAFFTGVALDEVDETWLDGLQTTFIRSGHDYKALVRETVLSDQFADPLSIRRARPTEFASVVEDLTGYRWETEIDAPCCGANSGSSPTGVVDLMVDDYHGYNQLAGGFDAFYVERHAKTFNATTLLVTDELARLAADFVVQSDFGEAPEDRRLLRHVDPDTMDPDAVRDQIGFLHARMFGELGWSPEQEQTLQLFDAIAAESGPERAWRVVLMAMLTDIRLVVF